MEHILKIQIHIIHLFIMNLKKENPYSEIILNYTRLENNCYKIEYNKTIIYCQYSYHSIKENKNLEVYYLDKNGISQNSGKTLKLSTLQLNIPHNYNLIDISKTNIIKLVKK